jgi:hypothetical protein
MTIKNKNNKPPVGGGGATTSNNNAVEPTIDPFIIPIGDSRRPRSLYNKDDGLDWLRKPSNDLPSNVVVTSSEISMLTPDGDMRVVDTYNNSADQWHSKNEMERRYNVRYDGRYEGRSESWPDDPGNFSKSGLSVRRSKSDKQE